MRVTGTGYRVSGTGYTVLMARVVGLVLALTVAASGSGLPMCVSLLATAAPCTMHQHERGSHDAHGAQLVPGGGHDMDGACHSGDGDIGCATGGTCPTGATAAPLAVRPVLSASGLGADAASTIDPAPHSFSSAPPPRPPRV
jgi:hypothetical protein